MKFTFKKVLYILSLSLMLSLFVGMLAITVDGLFDHVVDSDLAIVPGNKINPDGKPSARLQGRLDAALGLYKAGRCKAILVSGGIGVEGFDEAEVMKNYLMAQGVRQEHIYTDNHGTTTFETARFAAELVRTKNLHNPMLVSQFFHISRLRLALKKQGVQAAGSVHAQYFEMRDFYSVLREFFGFIEYAFK